MAAHKSSLWSISIGNYMPVFPGFKTVTHFTASLVNVPLLVFTPGAEAGIDLCPKTAENVPLSALLSATQNAVKQTVKLHGELKA